MNIAGIYKGMITNLLILLTLTGCVQEEYTGSKKDGEGMITFTLQLPQSGTRALSGTDKNTVSEIDILVFNSSANGGKFVGRNSIPFSEITPDQEDDSKKTFNVKLSQGNYDLVIFANAGTAIDATTLNGATKAEALAALKEEMPASGKWETDTSQPSYRSFPMWGDVGAITINENTNLTGNNAITMARMMARVDVAVSATNFQLSSVHVYNYNTEGLVAPVSTAWDTDDEIVTVPSVIPNVRVKGPIDYKNQEIDAENNSCHHEIYIFEAENLNGDTPKASSDRTCLVVGGIWDANSDGNFTNDGPATFYRVDFSTGKEASEKFMDVLRNHQYSVDIKKVSEQGYSTANDAFIGGSRITATVGVWNLAHQRAILGGQNFLEVDKDDHKLMRIDKVLFTAITDHADGIYIDESEIEYTPPVTSGNEWLSVIDNTGADGSTTRKFYVKALENSTNAVRSAKLKLRTGNLTKIINLTQDYSIAPLFARSNIVMINNVLRFATSMEENTLIPSNSQGLLFKAGSLVGAGTTGGGSNDVGTSFPVDFTAGHVVFSPEEFIIPVAWKEIPYFPGYTIKSQTFDEYENAYPGKGYSAEDGLGDICRYISDKGWVEGKWRLPKPQEYQRLYSEGKRLVGTFWPTQNITSHLGRHGLLSGGFQGRGVTGSETTADMACPPEDIVFLPCCGYRYAGNGTFADPGFLGEYWTVSSYDDEDMMVFSFGGLTPYYNIGTGSTRDFGMGVRCIRNFDE